MSDKEIILLEEVLKKLNTGENIKEYSSLENYNILRDRSDIYKTIYNSL